MLLFLSNKKIAVAYDSKKIKRKEKKMGIIIKYDVLERWRHTILMRQNIEKEHRNIHPLHKRRGTFKSETTSIQLKVKMTSMTLIRLNFINYYKSISWEVNSQHIIKFLNLQPKDCIINFKQPKFQ